MNAVSLNKKSWNRTFILSDPVSSSSLSSQAGWLIDFYSKNEISSAVRTNVALLIKRALRIESGLKAR
jgi:hypothetical protein